MLQDTHSFASNTHLSPSAPPRAVLKSSKKKTHFLHAYSSLQGPSYALAKSLENWRGILRAHQRKPVSFHHGPPTETKSVMQNVQFREFIRSGFAIVKPLELFPKAITKPILGWLLAADIVLPRIAKESDHVMDFMVEGGNFHGGLLNRGYDLENSKALQAIAYVNLRSRM